MADDDLITRAMTTKPEDAALSRRAMIGALAAVPVAALPVIASAAAAEPSDPIFAMIEASDAALAAFVACRPIEDNMPRATDLSNALAHANDVLISQSRRRPEPERCLCRVGAPL